MYWAMRNVPRSICYNICYPDELQYPNSIYIEPNIDLFAFADDSMFVCAEQDQINLIIKL